MKTHSDRQVLLVHLGFEELLLGLLDSRQNIWFSLIITLSSQLPPVCAQRGN
jgi:hypothetical protein